MNFNPNQISKPSAPNQVKAVDWESMDLEALLDLLSNLGVGYSDTIQYLLGKLKVRQGGVSLLMYFIKFLGIGKKGASSSAKAKLKQLKDEGKVSDVLYWSLFVLIARHDRKFQEGTQNLAVPKNNGNVFQNMNLNFTPPQPANPNYGYSG